MSDSAAAPLSLVPLPQHVSWTGGAWVSDDPWSGLSVGLSEDLPRTEYALAISADGAALTAGSEAALADGRNTFAQIVAGTDGSIPCVLIHDRPRHAWRGLHLDVARRFVDVPELEKIIDGLALHRFNVLHLHLTDDQGWRIEIKGYPRLTEVGARRERTVEGDMSGPPESWTYDETPHEGSYTQEELRDLVEYAKRRGVMIVPEVELPGHMQAAIAAYPQLGTVPDRVLGVREVWGPSDHVLGVSDEVFTFLRDVLSQVADIFPAPYVHIGGEDCSRVEWERSPEARRRLVEWGFTRISEIQGRFTRFAAEVLAEHGKRLIGWDGMLDSHVPDDAIIMVRDTSRLAETLTRGFQAIVATSDVLSLDRAQASGRDEPLAAPGRITLRDVREAQLVPAKAEDAASRLVLGVQAQMWTEHAETPELLERALFPRLCAVAELAWGSPDEGFAAFEERLRGHLPRLDAFGIAYRPLDD